MNPEWFDRLIQHSIVGLGLLLNVQVERNVPSPHTLRDLKSRFEIRQFNGGAPSPCRSWRD